VMRDAFSLISQINLNFQDGRKELEGG